MGIFVVSIEFNHVTSVQGDRVYQSTRVCGQVQKYGRVHSSTRYYSNERKTDIDGIVIRYKVYYEQHPRAGLNIQHVIYEQQARAGRNT